MTSKRSAVAALIPLFFFFFFFFFVVVAASVTAQEGPLQTLGRASSSLADAVADEAQLLPCTLDDVRGELQRLSETGVLQMAALPCEAWVRLTVSDAFGDAPDALAKAQASADGEPNDAIAFAVSPQEAAALRNAGVASGQAVALNDVVTAVAVGPRQPGFGGSASRLALRFGETLGAAAAGKESKNKNASEALWVDARYVDGGRPFPAPQQYKAVVVSPAAKASGASSSSSSSSTSSVNPDPNGLLVVLTAADPTSALSARKAAREPHLATDKATGQAANSATPVSVDATAPNARSVSGSFGTAPVPVTEQRHRDAVGGEAVAQTPPLSITSASTTGAFSAGAAEAGRPEEKADEAGRAEGRPGEGEGAAAALEGERRRLLARRRLLRDAME